MIYAVGSVHDKLSSKHEGKAWQKTANEQILTWKRMFGAFSCKHSCLEIEKRV